jgi:hypothetical protein
VFHCQLEAAADHKWTSSKKVVHLLTVLEGKAADVLHNIPVGETYKDIVGALKGHYGHHQLAVAYWVNSKPGSS